MNAQQTPRWIYQIVVPILAGILILMLLMQQTGQYLLSHGHTSQAKSIYKMLSLVPYQRAASQARLGDALFVSKDFANATIWYSKALEATAPESRCILYIKMGDSNANQAFEETAKDTKLALYTAATNNYQLCLSRSANNTLASDHKNQVEAELATLAPSVDQTSQPTTSGDTDFDAQSDQSAPQVVW